MKLLLLSIVVLAASCGKYEVAPGSSKIGEKLQPSALTSSDRSNLQSICNALGSRNTVVNTTLNFETFEGDCVGNTITNGVIPTTIQQSGSNFVLKRKTTGQDFIFPDLESPTQGLLGDICSNLANIENPVQSGADQVTYATTGSDIAECGVQNEQLCVVVKRASLQNGDYIVHTKDFMRVKVSDAGRTGKLGYFTFRKKISKSFCGINEQLVFSATLTN
jgi:hypothetical protein